MKTLRCVAFLAILLLSSHALAQDDAPPASEPPVATDAPADTEDSTADTPPTETPPESAPVEEPATLEEAAVAEPVKPEPVKPEPVKPEPVKAVKVKTQPEAIAKPVVAPAEAADPGATYKFYARLRPRLVLRANNDFGLDTTQRNYDAGEDFEQASLQARLGAKFTYNTLSGHIMLQYAGMNGVTGGEELTDPTMGVHIAYAKWQALEQLTVQIGRFELAYGQHRVLGTVGYHQTGRAWDGFRLLGDLGKNFKVDAFLTKYRNNGAKNGVSPYDGDAFLSGAYATYKNTFGKTKALVDLYALYDFRLREDGEGMERGLGVFGLRAKGVFPWVDFELEGAFQPGTQCIFERDDMGAVTDVCSNVSQDIAAYFVDAELGFGLREPYVLRGSVAYAIASGDDPDTDTFEGYNQMYPTAHKFMGRMDIIGARSNVQEIRAGVNWVYGITKGSLVYHDFTRLFAPEDSARVGGEIDLTLWLAVVKGLDVEFAYGLFLPDEGLSSDPAADPEGVAHWTSLTAVAKF